MRKFLISFLLFVCCTATSYAESDAIVSPAVSTEPQPEATIPAEPQPEIQPAPQQEPQPVPQQEPQPAPQPEAAVEPATAETASAHENCTAEQLATIAHASAGQIIDGVCKVTTCEGDFVPDESATACTCPADSSLNAEATECMYNVLICGTTERPEHSIISEKRWDPATNAYGPCVAKNCLKGFTLKDGACVAE